MSDRQSTALIQTLKRNIKQWLQQSQLQRVEDGLIELKVLDPLSLETRGLDLEWLVARRDYAQAEQVSKQLLNLFPQSSRIHYLSGKLAYRQKHYTRALTAFEQSYRLHAHWSIEWFIAKTLTQSGHFERAEPLLLRLVTQHPVCLLDLAWLYERKQQYSKALSKVEQYLKFYPQNNFARKKLQGLQVHQLSTRQLVEEVQTLNEFDANIPSDLLSEYISDRLSHGDSKAIRQWLNSHLQNIKPGDALQPGWACFHGNAFDLAYTLMVREFSSQHENDKYRRALETSAERSGQLEELIDVYQQYTEHDPRFFGRIVKLSKRL